MGKVKNVLKKIHTACKRLETSAKDNYVIKTRGHQFLIEDEKGEPSLEYLKDKNKDKVVVFPDKETAKDFGKLIKEEYSILPYSYIDQMLENSNNQQLEAVESLVVEKVVEDVNEEVVETVNETIDGAKIETSTENISGRTEVHLFIPEFDYETYDSNIDSTLQEFGLEADMADLYENAIIHEEYGEGTEVIIPVSKNDSRFLDKFTEALEEIGAVGVQIVRPELSSTVKNSLNQINTTTYSRLF